MSVTGRSADTTSVGFAAVSGIPGGRSGLLAGLFLLAGVASASAQFSAQPVIVELRTDDRAAAAVIAVRNESASPLRLRVYGADFDQPEDGSHVFLDLGDHPRTCGGRLEILPDDLVLEPHATGEVRVRLEPGDSTCWSLVFVEGMARDGVGIRIAQRIGVKVYGVSAGVRMDGEVEALRVATGANGSPLLEIAFLNTGESPIRPEGEVEIRSEAGEVVAVVPIAPFSVLPGRVIRALVPLDADLAAGTYFLIPILDFGGDYLAGGQAVLEIEGS